MPPCCCKCSVPNSTICLGRCDLPRHHCLTRKESTRKKPVPKHMGWLYTAKDSPEHQLRCGWRPGHILCPVLRKIERHNCAKDGCSIQSGGASQCPPPTSCCHVPRCATNPCPSPPPPCGAPPCLSTSPVIRIARHNGKYTITTEPAGVNNSPSSQYPLKYVFNNDDMAPDNAIYSIEAKYNDYQFDYVASESSFVIDFTPPDSKCRPCKPCRPCRPCYVKCARSGTGPAPSRHSCLDPEQLR